ncbi:hypothetical protein, partial [uncultured Nevskia sp.]|uniref:hypothetical protein n=1 Tax=uncultured Nevskia sp. TaxID=228950 RepID=UPI0025EB13E4
MFHLLISNMVGEQSRYPAPFEIFTTALRNWGPELGPEAFLSPGGTFTSATTPVQCTIVDRRGRFLMTEHLFQTLVMQGFSSAA